MAEQSVYTTLTKSEGRVPAYVTFDGPCAALFLPFGVRRIVMLLGGLLSEARKLGSLGLCNDVPRQLELIVVMDGASAALNHKIMGVLGPTNILSFPSGPLGAVASLVLSSETFCRECQLYGQNANGYFLRLLCHGLGHVCGFEHGPAMDVFTGQLESAGVGIFQRMRAE